MNNRFDELTKGLAQSDTRRGTLMKFGLGFAGTALLCLGLAHSTQAAPTFTTLDYPGAVFSAATEINNSEQITGWYIDTAGTYHGFLLGSGSFNSIDFPGAAHTSALGLNANGDVVGAYNLKEVGLSKDVHGYLLRNGVFTSIDFPGAAETRAIGINSAGDIAGIYTDQKQGKHHGFVLSAGVFTSIDFPGSAYTDVWKINDNGQIAGRYLTSGNEKFHLFLWTGGSFVAAPDFTGAAQMSPTSVCSHHSGMNGAGDIVTGYCDAKPVQQNGALNDNMLSNLHGLLWSGGLYTSIDFPDAIGTVAYGISDGGNIVGSYQDMDGRFHGYLRTP
jgi:uncharacterized membrane protein